MGKIKAIIKRPDEQYGHVTWISDNLKNLQNIVNGPIETLKIPNGVTLIFSEEGKLRGFRHNFNVISHHYINPTDYINMQFPIVGTVIACGTDGAEFADIPVSLADWKEMLAKWGN